MALTITFDPAQTVLTEPGFWQQITTRGLADAGYPADESSHYGVWRDEPTQTVMLRPLQLESSWLNNANQGASILRLGQDFYCNPADISSTSIFEAAIFGNADNPYIYHVPVGPAGAFPGHPEDVPGSAPSLVGVPTPINPTVTDLLTQGPTAVYTPSTTVPPANSLPPIVQIGDTTSGKFVAQSVTRMPANQPLFFRWFHPQSQLGFPCIYEFYIGQFKLRVKDVVIEIFLDISSAGDRSAWQKIQIAPLFSIGNLSPSGTGNVMAVVRNFDQPDTERTLLWLPFRRNLVLLYAGTAAGGGGKWALIQVNGSPQRLPDNSDWNIVRSDSLLVWVLTPAAGRFQVQKCLFPSAAITINSPVVQLDYTPSTAPNMTLSTDTDHGTTLTATQSQPPSYTLPTNVANDCPKATTNGPVDQRRSYGIQLKLTASADQRWTPFFYGMTVESLRRYGSSPNTPASFSDQNPNASVIQQAMIKHGLKPGEGHATIEMVDSQPAGYPLAPYYYRPAIPVQIQDGGTAIFTGITEPFTVTPIRASNSARRLSVKALDRWKILKDTYLRDQRDWSGFGHIDIVKFVVEQAGIDCTSAEWPAGYTPANNPEQGTITTLNSALGGQAIPIAQQTKDLKQGWAPRDNDTAASYIERIANFYSGWYVGFRLDGTFFYLPRTYFTTPTVTFQATAGGPNPVFRDPVRFITQEPEANVILVKASNSVNGQIAYSSLWVDWGSIKNPAKVNYLGRWRAEVVQMGGAFSCSQLNWMARKIWEQTRRRRVQVIFEADFVPTLKVGQVFTLGSYGNYRLVGFNVRIQHAGVHHAAYEGELVENGF